MNKKRSIIDNLDESKSIVVQSIDIKRNIEIGRDSDRYRERDSNRERENTLK
jgi:hypothetical protein